MNEFSKDPRLGDSTKKQPKTAAEIQEHCSKGVEICEEFDRKLNSVISKLEKLPLLGVDNEALDVGSLSVDLLRSSRSCLFDLKILLKEWTSAAEDGDSWGTFFEVIIKGDRRISQRQEDLKNRWIKVTERFSENSKTNDKVNSEIRRARIILTQRYRKDFPDLN